MPIYERNLASLQPGANEAAASIDKLRELIMGSKNKMAEQQNQANVDVGKSQQMLPIEKQGYQNKADVDVQKEGTLQNNNIAAAKKLTSDLEVGSPGTKYSVNLGAGGGVSYGQTEMNPMAMMAKQQHQAEGYSKRLENVNGFNSALQEIEGATNRDGKGGVLSNPNATTLSKGGMKGLIPDAGMGIAEMIGVVPKGATEESKGFQRLANEYMKATSGMRVTPEAAAREKAAMGNVISGDPQLAAKGARALGKMMKERLAAIQGGYDQPALDQVHAKTGDPAAFYSTIYDDNAVPPPPMSFEEFKQRKAAGKL